jgi:uncharacterized protein YkwD
VADERCITGRATVRKKQPLVLLLASMVALLAFTVGCESTAHDRNEVMSLINQSRVAAGLRPLQENVTLAIKADKWAQHLRDICDLKHSRLSDGAPREWLKLGENVGYGGSIAQVHDAYLNSPGHRANILDPSFTSMGTAAVWGDCNGFRRVFTVQEFMKS